MHIDFLEPAAGDYRPGACNIGPREIAKRRAFGIAGIVATVVLGAVLLVIDAPQIARAIVLIPLWGAIVSLEQARRKFCAAFAYAGIRSVNGSDATESVARAADLALDRAAARRLVAECGVIAAAITAVFIVLPV
jgi:hypothetical protein